MTANQDVSDLQEQLKRQTRELEEARDERAALAEVLRVISSSPRELEPVFEAVLANAVRICEAKFGVLYLHEAGAARAAAQQVVGYWNCCVPSARLGWTAAFDP
jgi:hypothetical protein